MAGKPRIFGFSQKIEAVEDFIAHKDQFMKGMTWQHDCRSWIIVQLGSVPLL